MSFIYNTTNPGGFFLPQYLRNIHEPKPIRSDRDRERNDGNWRLAMKSNPLSLTVSEPVFETWLRDKGFLEILDQRTTSVSAAQTATPTAASVSSSSSFSPFNTIQTLLSLLTLNPFSKLTAEDFSNSSATPSWTKGFIGSYDSYSFPKSPTQARLRVHENVKRYARNYSYLFILAFACSLYQMPLAIFGLISCLALWELIRVSSDRWKLDNHPTIRQTLVRTAQCASAVVLFLSNVQMALFCALAVTYAVLVIHATCRKLSPVNQSNQRKRK